jgi:hypothetical protein
MTQVSETCRGMTVPNPGKPAMGMGVSVSIPAGESVDQVFRTSHKLHSTSSIYGSTTVMINNIVTLVHRP